MPDPAVVLRELLAGASLVPLALADGREHRVTGWGAAGRPERLRTLSVLSAGAGGGAALIRIQYDVAQFLPRELRDGQLLASAASLELAGGTKASVRTDVADARVMIDDTEHAAEVTVQGPLAAVAIATKDGGEILVATAHLDASRLRLTSRFDVDAAIRAAHL